MAFANRPIQLARSSSRAGGGRRGKALSVTRTWRPAGEECRTGEVLLEAGTVVTPAAMGLLAAAGIDEVEVRRVPRVALVLFGDELVATGVAGIG